MENGLCSIQARELDEFICDYLFPDTTFLTELRADIDSISAFLKERCFQGAAHPVRVSRVVMGGSYDEHTALKGKSEAKMVLFFNNLTSFEEQLKRRGEFVEEIQKHLCQLQQEKPFKVKFEVQSSEEPNSRSLSFKLSSPELQQEVEFDVQPAYDVLYELRNNTYAEPQFYNKVYAQLIHECTTLEKEGDFSICFTDLHQNFMRYRAPKLWNLIRLVKHWYQLCKEKLREPLPPQYALELLTVYVWEHSNKNQEKVTTAKNFRTFLELVAYYKNLRIYWTWYYDFRHQEVCAYLCRQLKKARPLILDPADPTRNVAGSDLQAWDLLAKEAQTWMQSSCFRNCDMSFVPTWDLSPERQECAFQ
ncbi:inactive 2'-5' oligoadenylate synthetase 1C [Mus musculus]|uniref:Inactive 2'-5' oligoadenylate synthetase 1C n=2 Tax=Mus musculus TaxID=10090 RepID=OAS1C_MOUSE|nr:inactive 2'-5' oligoadenylate synthetase 1C [Mus musculus]Q924S2.1 RecName: Full=Inactive 2'-5' oligoadenylate synthetase 1C; AltName: Full=2',5'-oligoadenylate synthetase-like 5 [Mus musculus]AAI08956.1 2'-5' oligoadenylate synthetase 1C [Mus musculus]AAI26878.1 2'-5' oligoadenylate synthetase 1C [Mus musculus]AAM47560.1 2'-5'olygoadenylate synthetase 1c [Mus musculus]EDL19749.1 mCG16011, isoform CRA_b [Mus musculus]BAB62296.1 2',5'-oligoadenylate synthetase-like 5 [Mus musculus]|eukprot:NP_291019.1 inactive 2'-5' oligoadenylate synthetase 1C [Mus musculus]